ncbi:hypothetical protein PROFUN_02016 [Planoprotostelium fungivorum]|uniref:Uncharacterized protein n=1 Tax=Planoprotostelium fungivorum TaxID=1890364 RepID=A0A2P6NB48_9EUKA|nr:hypothetical protein PROFUN_02016 [Planoprotostelium fungivorum]
MVDPVDALTTQIRNVRLAHPPPKRPIVLAVDPKAIPQDADDDSRDRFQLYIRSLLGVSAGDNFLIKRSHGAWRRANKLHWKLYIPISKWENLMKDPASHPGIKREFKAKALTFDDVMEADEALDKDTYGWLGDGFRYTETSPMFNRESDTWTPDRDNDPMFIIRHAFDVQRENLVDELYRLWSDVLQVAKNLKPKPVGFGTTLCGQKIEGDDLRYDVFVSLGLHYHDYYHQFNLPPPASEYNPKKQRSYHDQ